MTVIKTVIKTVTKEQPVRLIKRGNIYWSNLRLAHLSGRSLILPDPFGVVRVSKIGSLRISLKTGDKKEAQLRGYRLALAVDEWEKRRAASIEPITHADIQLAADLMRGALLAADDETHSEALAAGLSGEVVDREPDRYLASAVPLPAPGITGDVKLLARLAELIPFYVQQATGKVPAGPITPDYFPFAAAFRDLHSDLLKRGAGQTVPTPTDPRLKAAKAAKAAFTWDNLLAYYFAAHPALSERSRALYQLVIKNLSAFCKCQPAELKRAQVVDWRDSVVVRLAPKTALTRVRAGRTLYHYALVNEKFGDPRPADAFEGVTVAGAKSAKSGRVEFTLDELQMIFASPPVLSAIPAAAGAHAALWLPLIGAFTGARRSEILGLLADEVVQDPKTKIWYLDFKDNSIRTLKVDSCARKTPIHKTLIDLGFLDYARAIREAGTNRLFPGVIDPNACSTFCIEWFHARIGSPPAGVLKDVHSFRHCFKTASRSADVQTEVHDVFTGHVSDSKNSGKDYGSPAWLPTLKNAMDKIEYPGVKFLPPPLPTPPELKALQAAADRRSLHGRNRVLARERSAVRAAARAARVQVRRGRPRKVAQPSE